MRPHHLLAVAIVTSIPVLATAQSISPYVGQQERPIKSLSADEIRSYLAGDGLGMAKAGELNHYPGPKHVLAMAEHLALGADQKKQIGAVANAMTAAAVPLGREIVSAERALNQAFATGRIDGALLSAQTRRIATLQGRLRAVHLSAHLATRRLLTASQVTMYDTMRGYGNGAGSEMQSHHM